jgi:hypothetical protein
MEQSVCSFCPFLKSVICPIISKSKAGVSILGCGATLLGDWAPITPWSGITFQENKHLICTDAEA